MHNPLDPGYYESEELRSFGFRSVGENVRISRRAHIHGFDRIELGHHVRIDAFTTLVATTGILRFGGYNHIAGHSHFCAAADLTVEEMSGCSAGVRIYTASDDYSGRSMMGPMVPRDLCGVDVRPVHIARHVTIGANSVVLPGAHIGEGSVVGALSLVNRPLRPWGIYHGNPVKRLRDRARDVEAAEAEMWRRAAADHVG